jgi:hypothetical protein
MKSIKFSNEELNLLQKQYREELHKAEKYVEQVKEILKKLGAINESAITEGEISKPKRGRKKKTEIQSPVVIKEKKKRGRKPRMKDVADVVQVIEENSQLPVEPLAEKKKAGKLKKSKKSIEPVAEKEVTTARKRGGRKPVQKQVEKVNAETASEINQVVE